LERVVGRGVIGALRKNSAIFIDRGAPVFDHARVKLGTKSAFGPIHDIITRYDEVQCWRCCEFVGTIASGTSNDAQLHAM
jgi:hypothetical protein